MNQWDEEALSEINSLEAARLAIRGALSTIRNLQDINIQAKAEVQNEAAKRQSAEAQVAELNGQLDRWRAQAEAWEKEGQQRAQGEQRWREAARLEARAEERTLIEENRARMETELARLHAELQQISQSFRARTQEQARSLGQIKKALESQEVELLAARREKDEVARRAQHDAQILEQLRQQRDQEINSFIKSRELEIAALREQVAELNKEKARALADRAKEVEAQLAARRQELEDEFQRQRGEAEARAADDKQRALQSLRENMESELRRRQEVLLESAARKDAQRVREQDDFTTRKSAELDQAHAQRLGELLEKEAALEESFRQKEAAAQAGLERRRREFFDEQDRAVAAEKESWAGQFAAKKRALEAADAERSAELERFRQDEERKYRSWKTLAEAEFSQKARSLDAQWAARERALLIRHEAGMEEQRRIFQHEIQQVREQLEARLRQIETEAPRLEAGKDLQIQEASPQKTDAPST
jgi:hypothetical protein